MMTFKQERQTSNEGSVGIGQRVAIPITGGVPAAEENTNTRATVPIPPCKVFA